MIVFLDTETDLSQISSIDDLRIIREEDFFDFQNMIREAVG
jgi:hypothetical protein